MSADPKDVSSSPPSESHRPTWWGEVVGSLNPVARLAPAEPHKELRFTRSHQAAHFAWGACLALAAMVGLALLAWSSWGKTGEPLIRVWWLPLLPLPVILGALWAVAWCATHAYILLSPVGVEIFPLFHPVRGYRLVPWAQITALRIERNCVVLDFVGAGGIVLGLDPIRPSARPLLVEALQRRLAS